MSQPAGLRNGDHFRSRLYPEVRGGGVRLPLPRIAPACREASRELMGHPCVCSARPRGRGRRGRPCPGRGRKVPRQCVVLSRPGIRPQPQLAWCRAASAGVGPPRLGAS
ncbi:unnamed protein product [Eretmochelys imbricata]